MISLSCCFQINRVETSLWRSLLPNMWQKVYSIYQSWLTCIMFLRERDFQLFSNLNFGGVNDENRRITLLKESLFYFLDCFFPSVSSYYLLWHFLACILVQMLPVFSWLKSRFWINLRFFVLGWGRDCLHLVVLFDSIAGFHFHRREHFLSLCTGQFPHIHFPWPIVSVEKWSSEAIGTFIYTVPN